MGRRINGAELMSDFNFASKYAKYDNTKQRREIWPETISRMRDMHLDKYKNKSQDVQDDIKKAFQMVVDKKVLASQRAARHHVWSGRYACT